MNIIHTVNSSTALDAAAAYAGLERCQVYCTYINRHEGMYEISFQSDWLRYDCYVDASDAQVLGFSFEPIPDSEMLQCNTGGVFWKTCGNVIAAYK